MLAAALLLWHLAIPGAAAQSEKETRARLEQLQEQMQQLDRELRSERSHLGTLQNQLRDAEVALGSLRRDAAANQARLQQSRSRLAELQRQHDELQRAREQQEALITAELRRAYQTGVQGPLKVLLNQQQPDTLARAMTYYQYLYQARYRHIQDYRETLAELAALARKITATTAKLEQLSAALQQQQRKLLAAQEKRQQAMARLSESIASKDDRLQQLARNRAELERLLQVIRDTIATLAVPKDYGPFKDAAGNMPWPLPGKPSNRFGRPRNEGKMRWQGVTIPARQGTEVKAIHHGRVVFADWFGGSGLLLVIDHGDGYMSLYAHNEALLRDVGEWVTAGTPISTAGNSGGQEASGLYFEIRHQGKPVDPARWCRG